MLLEDTRKSRRTKTPLSSETPPELSLTHDTPYLYLTSSA